MKVDMSLRTIVVVDDSPADRKLIIKALEGALLHNPIQEIENGEELMDYLLREGVYAHHARAHDPCLILLDLYMPVKNGLEALQEIKNDPALRHIPVIILTTSKSDREIGQAYKLGVNSFVTKPVDLGEFAEVIESLGDYWLDLVTLPPDDFE